jgi:hypothetical protein
MTRDDIDHGCLICPVAIAPVEPTEFAVLGLARGTIEARDTP